MFGALPAEIFGIGLVFCRVGAIVMLLPGIGEQGVPPRVRLGLALVLSLAFYPIVRSSVPPVSATVGDMGVLVILEIVVGVAIGSLLRFFLSTLAVAGEAVSLQTTLSFAQTANPGQAQPSASLATFLTLLGLTLIFATDLHHLFIAAIVKSYTLFPIGRPIPVGDFAQLAIRTFADTFALGIQLAAPVIVFSLVFNIAAGFIGRVMPQFQIFFVATPLSVLLGLSLFALSLGAFGLVWVDRFREFLERWV
jgi:flagellar biosynthetic protein FliR